MRRTLYNWHDHLASRRGFLAAAVLGAAAARNAVGDATVLQALHVDWWDTADAILKRITAPRFPESGPFPSASITGVRLADCAFENANRTSLTNVRVNGELRRGSP